MSSGWQAIYSNGDTVTVSDTGDEFCLRHMPCEELYFGSLADVATRLRDQAHRLDLAASQIEQLRYRRKRR